MLETNTSIFTFSPITAKGGELIDLIDTSNIGVVSPIPTICSGNSSKFLFSSWNCKP